MRSILSSSFWRLWNPVQTSGIEKQKSSQIFYIPQFFRDSWIVGWTLTSSSWLWVMPQAELRDKSILGVKGGGIPWISNTNCPQEIHRRGCICRMFSKLTLTSKWAPEKSGSGTLSLISLKFWGTECQLQHFQQEQNLGAIRDWRTGHMNIPRRVKYLAQESADVKVADLKGGNLDNK